MQVTQTLGDRRDSFIAQRDPWEVVRIIVEGRKRGKLDPTVELLEAMRRRSWHPTSETPKHVKDQITGQLEFMETLMGWYESIKGLPRSLLLKMMRMGHKIAKVIGD